MEIKECHRVLELEIGASRDAVEAAYLRLLERWHPDRVTPADDAAAIAEATRMVQAVNEAYQTLIKIAPANPTQAAESVSARKKPTLSPLTSNFTPGEKPPPPPKPTSAPPPPPPRLAAPPPFAPPQPLSDKPAPSIPPPPAPAPVVPPPSPVAPSPATSAAQPTAKRPPTSSLWGETKGMHNAIFPMGTARRRFSPLIIAAALFLLFLLARWALPASHHKSARDIPPDPTKTGNIVVKSNRPDTEVELSGGPTAQQAASATFHGSGPDVTLRGLLPGKYVLTAKSTGWTDIRQDVNVDIGQATSVAVHFKTGSLHLESVPERVLVRWGETSLGHTPLVIPALPVGECRLTLEYPQWPGFIFTTVITENQQTEATARLPHGRLIVESVPAGATVLMRNRAVGQTPVTLELVPVGIRKLTLQAKGFPPQEISFKMEDNAEVKLSRELGTGFPNLDAPTLLRAVWVPDDPNQLAPGVDSLGIYEPRNGIVKNINRKRLHENWLKRSYRYTGTIKSYDRETGKVEFTEQTDALSKYHVVAELSPAARSTPDLMAQLTKGTILSLYGRLDAVEEPRWPFKVITFELFSAELLH
jgi:hypothetical protein